MLQTFYRVNHYKLFDEDTKPNRKYLFLQLLHLCLNYLIWKPNFCCCCLFVCVVTHGMLLNEHGELLILLVTNTVDRLCHHILIVYCVVSCSAVC